MGHMVIFRGGDGKPGYHQVEELAAAIQHVEHLRNDEGIDHAQIFQMEEVTFEFRPYFRVEIGTSGAMAPQAEPEVAAEPEPVAAAPVTSWAARMKDAAAHDASAAEPATMEPGALAAIVGEPAGEPWPEHDAAMESHDDALASNGARRGLFGR